MEGHKKAIIIYCRVSTKEQAEEGNSLTTQERICREYADKCGFSITKVFIERGKSGKTQDRIELQNLFKFCSTHKNKVFAVIVYKIDRLSRNLNDYINIKIRLQSYGTTICSTSEQFDNNPAGRFMENILANVAQFDNDVRTERSVNGMKDAARSGRFIWRAPYGYINRKVNNNPNIIPDPITSLGVIKAFYLINQCKYTIEEARAHMLKEGMTLSKSQFYRIFNNRAYCGIIERFGENNPGVYQPLITKDVFHATQIALKNPRKRITPYRTQNPDFPLRRFVLSESGLKLTGSWSTGKGKIQFAYYRFLHKGSNYKKESLEKQFAEFMNSFSFDRKELDKLLDHIKVGIETYIDSMKSMHQAKSTELKHIEGMQATLIQKNLKGVISDFILKKQLEALDTQICEIQNGFQINEGEKEINYFELIEEVQGFLISPGNYWLNCDFETKLKLQIWIFPQGVVLHENKFRTPIISLLFNEKSDFLAQKSHMAGHVNNNTNTPEMQNPSSCNERIIYYMDELKKFKKYVLDKGPMIEAPLWYKYQRPHKSTLRSRLTSPSKVISLTVSEPSLKADHDSS